MTHPLPQTADQLIELRRANGARCAAVIRARGPVTIAELAQLTGLSRPTVTARLQDLRDGGLVTEDIGARRGAGRPASRFAFVPDAALVAGLELGKHVERLMISDLAGREIWHGERPAPAADAEERLDAASDWVLERAQSLGRRLAHVGVAVPGALDPEGVFVESAAFRQWIGREVPPIIRAAFPVPVTVLHDVAGAMLAEQRMGTAVDVRTFVVPILWHRVSAGIVVSGAMHTGHSGRAGAPHLCSDLHTSGLDDIEWPSDPEVSALVVAAESGDPSAAASLDRFSALAAEQIAMLQLVVDPELIVLHGPLAGHGSLVERVVADLDRRVSWAAPVVVSEFGQYGTVMGATIAALDDAAGHLIGPGMPPHVLDRSRLSPAIGGRVAVPA